MKKIKGFLKQKQGEVTGVASTDTPDRDGESIQQLGWDLRNFKKNPVILASHQHSNFPIGTATEIGIEDGKLMFKAIFSKATQEAKEAYQLVKEGILRTFSVGFVPKEYDKSDGNIITKAELLEISLVSVPANPEAVVIAKGLKNKLADKMVKDWLKDSLIKSEVESLEKKAVIPYSIHGDSKKAPAGVAWDAGVQVAKADTAKLKEMSAWYDADHADNKTAYKLPHHRTDGRVVFRGVTSAMAALMGARGEVDIPAEDRKGVYDHLAKHYKQFERTAPEFRFILDIATAVHNGKPKDKKSGEDGKEVEAPNLKLLQRTVGYMQEVCCEMKKGGKIK